MRIRNCELEIGNSKSSLLNIEIISNFSYFQKLTTVTS